MAVCIVVLLALLGIFFWVSSKNKDNAQDGQEQDEASVTVTDDDADQVTAVSFQIGGRRRRLPKMRISGLTIRIRNFR